MDILIADNPEITPSYLRMHSNNFGGFIKFLFVLCCLGSCVYCGKFAYENKEKIQEKLPDVGKQDRMGSINVVVQGIDPYGLEE